jgi:hypothetical protein
MDLSIRGLALVSPPNFEQSPPEAAAAGRRAQIRPESRLLIKSA